MQEREVTTRTLLAYGSGDIYGGGSFLIISTLFIFFLSNVACLSPCNGRVYNPCWKGMGCQQ